MVDAPPAAEPRATVVVPLLNHAAFVADQLQSLFRQWSPAFELLLIDDGSRDDGFAIAQRCVAEHPAVSATLMRNSRTSGIGLVHSVLRHASCPVIIQADSDDISLPGRLHSILRCFDEDPRCRLVTSNAVKLSVEGLPIGLFDLENTDMVQASALDAAGRRGDERWLGATSAFHREVFDAFPVLDPAVFPPMPDLLLAFRAALIGTHHYLSAPLVGWRQHAGNSHRQFGALELGNALADHFGYMELLVLAQKLRDVQHLQAAAGEEAERAEVSRSCTNFLIASFETWARKRGMHRVQPAVALEQPSPPYVPPVPPIVTLRSGERIDFRAGGRGAGIVPGWSGFHLPETWGVWTQRHAMLCFRVADNRITRLALGFKSNPLFAAQELQLGLYGEDWTRFDLEQGDSEVELPIPMQLNRALLVTLMISTPQAISPAQVQAGVQDTRLLGVGLISIMAR